MTITMTSMTRIARKSVHERTTSPKRIPAISASLIPSSLDSTFLTTLIRDQMKKHTRNATKAYSVPFEKTVETIGNASRAKIKAAKTPILVP